jgi:putative transposase
MLWPKPLTAFIKAEVIYKRRTWRRNSEVELATLEWVDWFNSRRLLGPIGDIPTAEAERMFWERLNPPAMAA